MSLPKSCKTKSCYSQQYGCSLLYDCEIYEDTMADAKYEVWLESDEARELLKEEENDS